ncbi:hypothetical protein NG798_12385 [Ancylothrix sp. C2]|nr:hypothetical protein [Ancylothrix sp. D3o]
MFHCLPLGGIEMAKEIESLCHGVPVVLRRLPTYFILLDYSLQAIFETLK